MLISFNSLLIPRSGSLILGVDGNGRLTKFARQVDKACNQALSMAISAVKFSGKSGSFLDVFPPKKSGLSHILLAGLGEPDKFDAGFHEKFGGQVMGRVQEMALAGAVTIAVEKHKGVLDPNLMAAHTGLGVLLRSYKFDKYKSVKTGKDNKKKAKTPLRINILCTDEKKTRKVFVTMKKVASGVFVARDLINEPPNVIYPASFARQTRALSKYGVKVEVLGEAQMTKLGMNALLGVGQGSVRESKLVVMRWNGARKAGTQSIAFVGKGVTFDTGGISLKPGAGMGNMKGDMSGAACVTGLMQVLAARKAKVNAVGVIALSENMPGGNAQRPGDIVISMSGQSIEILNTDAEGRLILADALWYTQKRFKPKFMIDLATLTGAILSALGQERAGLFSSSDELSKRLYQVGEATGERVWRLPLGEEYDKMINSKVADMQNIGGRYAGSITAAQFLQRFTNEVPWAHLDIAGTAMNSPVTPINQSWGSGFGVRLLNELVARYYEK